MGGMRGRIGGGGRSRVISGRNGRGKDEVK